MTFVGAVHAETGIATTLLLCGGELGESDGIEIHRSGVRLGSDSRPSWSLLLLGTGWRESGAGAESALDLEVLVSCGSGGDNIPEGAERVPLGSEHGLDFFGETSLEVGQEGGLVPGKAGRQGTELGDVIDHGATGLAKAEEFLGVGFELVLVAKGFLEELREGVIGYEDTILIRNLAVDIGSQQPGRGAFHGLECVHDSVWIGEKVGLVTLESRLELGLEFGECHFGGNTLELGGERRDDMCACGGSVALA